MGSVVAQICRVGRATFCRGGAGGRRRPHRAFCAGGRQSAVDPPRGRQRAQRRLPESCTVARVAEQGGRAAGYRGTVALNVVVPNPSWKIVLVALDLWDHVCILRFAAPTDRENPFWLLNSWTITTDRGTSHVSRSGGGSSLRWLVKLEPSLPDDTKEIRVSHAPNDRRRHSEASLPTESNLVVALPSQRVSVKPAGTRLDGDADLRPPVEAGLNLENEPLQPDRVIPVSAQLDDAVVGRDICVLSIEVRPSWFFLHLGGSGELAPAPDQAPDSGLVETMKLLGHRWSVEDNRGGQYWGTVMSSHSGWPWTIDAVFTPALDPSAARLALEFPNPFGNGVIHTTVELPPVGDPGQRP